MLHHPCHTTEGTSWGALSPIEVMGLCLFVEPMTPKNSVSQWLTRLVISWLITGSPGCRRYRHSEKGLRRFWMGFGRLLQQSGRMQYCHTCAWERTCIFSQDAAEMRIQMRA